MKKCNYHQTKIKLSHTFYLVFHSYLTLTDISQKCHKKCVLWFSSLKNLNMSQEYLLFVELMYHNEGEL